MIWLVYVGLVLLTVYEIWAAITNKLPTLSEWIWKGNKHTLGIAFWFGVLIGHFFF